MNDRFFYIPESFNADCLLNSDLVKPVHLDKVHYVLSKLYYSYMINGKDGVKWNEFINLHSKILERVLTCRKAKLVMDELVDSGILESDDLYIKGYKSYGYRYQDDYRGVFIKTPIYDGKFYGKLIEFGKERLKNVLENHKGRYHIFKSIQEIDYDAAAALEFVNFNHYVKGKYIWDAYDYRRFVINETKRVNKGHFLFKTDSQGRLYTPFTSLSRDTMPFTTWKGKKLYSVDLCNSQPALLSGEVDCPKWRQLCQQNELYSHLNAITEHQFDLSDKNQKTEFKQKLFAEFLYCENHLEGEMAQVIKNEFPAVYNAAHQLKENDYTTLPCRLQSTESKIIIDDTATQFAESFPDSCLLSKHDCLITTEEYLEDLQNMIKTNFKNRVGFNPAVSVEDLEGNKIAVKVLINFIE